MVNSKIFVWHTGEVYIDQSLAFEEQTWHPVPYTGWLRPKTKKRWFPVSAYLIEHPKGTVLVDTGWHADVRTNYRKHVGFFSSTMFKGLLPEGSAVHEQLHKIGLTPNEIDYVFLTHLHSDHVSGLRHVAQAGTILVSKPEWKAAQTGISYPRSMWKGVRVTPFELAPIPHGPYKLGLDLFQDGSVYAVYTPGHSAGQCSVMVQTVHGWVLLAGDVGYAVKSFSENLLPGFRTNRSDAQRSLNWVKEFAAREDSYRVLVNHDPEVVPHIIG